MKNYSMNLVISTLTVLAIAMSMLVGATAYQRFTAEPASQDQTMSSINPASLFETHAHADSTTINNATFSAVIASVNADDTDQALFMLDKSSGILLVYRAEQRGGGFYTLKPIDLLDVNETMEDAAKRLGVGGGNAPGRPR